MVLATCEDLDMDVPIFGSKITKKDFGILVVIVDIFVVLTLITFIWALEIGQDNYIKMF